MPSATISTTENLNDYNSRIEAALVEHSGTITLTGSGVMSATEIDIEDVADVTVDSGVTIERITTNSNDALEASSTRAVVRFASGSSGTWTGGIIDADGGSYSAIGSYSGSGDVELVNVDARNATYKQISLNGNAVVTNCSASSNVQGVIGSHPRPAAFEASPFETVADTLTVNGLTIGMAYGSREGQMVKIARYNRADLSNVTTPATDEDTWYSLVLGEELGVVVIDGCNFPRKITHFPDDTGGADTMVDLLVIADTTIGNDDEAILYLHDGSDGLKAKSVVYINVTFKNSGATCIIDDTPAASLSNRIFIGCTFDTATASTLISHRDGAGTLTGRIRWANCTFVERGDGEWTKPADWDASEITLPTGYSTADLVEMFS